jgi:hypothetical protein
MLLRLFKEETYFFINIKVIPRYPILLQIKNMDSFFFLILKIK